MPLNLPILLTWLRILAIPLLIAVYYLPPSWATIMSVMPQPPLFLWRLPLLTGLMDIWLVNSTKPLLLELS
jgi:phosphatidylglycerophosphate synthase